MKWRNLLVVNLIIYFVTFGVIQFSNGVKTQRLKDEIGRLQVDLAHASIYQPVVHDTIFGNIPVATAQIVEMDKKAYKKQVADKKLMSELDIKPAQVMHQQTVTQSVRDTVYLTASRDSLITYHDEWTDMRFSLRDSSLQYHVRDSVITFVYKEYKHRFLFFRWGTKGYRVKIVNHNPNATINHAQFISVN